jgi:ABC-type nitrate/sulfonate/bicarbonate transport system permease component
VIFAAASVFFTTVLTATDGFRSASSSAEDVFRTLGARRWPTFVRLQLPGSAPFIADAVRLAVPAALLGAILGEWFGANSGLGLVMVSSMRNVQVELLWAATVMAVAVSLALYALGTLAERAATRTFGRPVTVRRGHPVATRPLDVAIAVSLPLVLIGGWQWWVSARDLPAAVAPTPHQVLDALATNWQEYLHAAGLTLVSSLGGLVCGALLGAGLAIVSVLFGWIRASASAITLLIPTIPIVVFIPIIGSVAGYGMTTVLICCVLMAFFPVYVIVLSGLGARPAGSDDLFRVYGANRFVVLARLAVPASLPSMFLALRLSAANCVLIALSAEWLMDVGGLGRIFSDQQVTLNTAKGWAAVVVAIVLSAVAYRLAALAERWAANRWS